MNEPKYQLCYVMVRRDKENNEMIACGVFKAKDRNIAESTAKAYSEENLNFIYELQTTALFE